MLLAVNRRMFYCWSVLLLSRRSRVYSVEVVSALHLTDTSSERYFQIHACTQLYLSSHEEMGKLARKRLESVRF